MERKSTLTSIKNGILTLTINRPEKLNALSQATVLEISEVVDEIYNNDEIKGAIITGSGEKAFVAGADISEFVGFTPAEGKMLGERGQFLFDRIERSPKVIIAAVNGFALGGGCELAMCCHFRVAAENAMFGQPEVNLGIVPGYGGTQRMAQHTGKGMAMELLLTGSMIDAERAKSIGLVNHIVTQEELIPFSETILSRIISKSPMAVAKTIKSINAGYDDGVDGYKEEIKNFSESFDTGDFLEGTSAFLEKRKPDFTKGKSN
ncbi:MAG: enoyl-CoA hydratase/isomerase family protein [Flavobacteriales bacterium]|nr:enoyl-CoA hydratase/isomerase family protein [Flavobacteriales bacterium]